MKTNNQQFKIQLILRNGKNQSNIDKRLVTDSKKKSLFDIQRKRSFTPNISSDKRHQWKDNEKDKRVFGLEDSHFNKEKESKEFSQKCFHLLSRKKISLIDEHNEKRNKFTTMLQNIKDVIKQNEKKQKQPKNEPIPSKNQPLCIRSQIHQIYDFDDKIQLYKMIRSNESKSVKSAKRQSREKIYQKMQPNQTKDEFNHFMLNPFLAHRTIVCFTMALNQPQSNRKTLFQAPATRPSTSISKRTIQIAKPNQTKAMCFQINGDDNQYMRKLKNFLDFLFKINYSNNIYISLEFKQETSPTKYKVFIGKGNNSLLIKSLMKRRFWWDIVDNCEDMDVNFYWSQNIVEKIHGRQRYSIRQVHLDKQSKKICQEEVYDLNRKILPLQKCQKVEKYIQKDSFIIPFEQCCIPDLVSNHLPRNYCIGSKKNLFKSLFHYFTHSKNKNPFDYIPKTYHIKSNEDKQYKIFVKQNSQQPQKVWIVKPGQNSNRGNGILLSTFNGINNLLKKSKHENGQTFTYIVQSYINKPFLYNNRKFDIRHYLLLTSVNGLVKAYWYKQGYIRTSSEIYDLEDLDNTYIHLTNDAIQKQSEDYQKYEPANKLSYSEFQRYLDYTYPNKYNFEKEIIAKMKELATYVVKANYSIIDHRRHQNNFQIFGLDFMIDRDFKPWLIEVNYNPCLEVNCPVLERVIPAMVQNSFRIGLDPLYPPLGHFPVSKRFYLSDHYLKNLRYQLIFDEQVLRAPINNDYDFMDEKQVQQQYQDQGHQVIDLQV